MSTYVVHIDADGATREPYFLRGQEDIEPRAAAEINDCFTLREQVSTKSSLIR